MMENGGSYNKGRGLAGAMPAGMTAAGAAAAHQQAMEDRRNPQRYGTRPQYGYDKIKERVNTELSGPQFDLPALDTAEKKFNANSRLFVGNLPRDIPYEELKSIFSKYGELGQVYFNKDGAYAFINFDYRANAEKAKRELQGTEVRNRPLKIRYASITTGVRVKNLTGCVSNELLEKAFNVFGQIESCRVIVDDRGKPTGEGIVIFADKKGATLAVKKCHEECYFLTSALRPVIVDPLEARDEEEGNPESSMHKNEQYKQERKEGPRFADKTSFEYEYGIRWKRLYEMYKEKKMLLESDLQAEVDQLERRLAIVKHEHETEKLRQELIAREQEAIQMGRQMFMRTGGSGGGSSSSSYNNSGYSSLGGYSSSSGLSSSYSGQGSSGYGSSSGGGGGYGSQGGYGGGDRYSMGRGDRYSDYDRRDDRYADDRYSSRMQDDRYMLQDDRYKGGMRGNFPQGGAGGMGGGAGGTASPAPGAGAGGVAASPGTGKGPVGGIGSLGQSDQAGDMKRDNMPGGRDNMPGGRDNMSGGRDNMPGGRDNMPGGRDNMPGGRDNMPGGRDNMPGGRDNMPGGRDNLPGGRDNMPAGRDNMPGGNQQFPQGGMKGNDMPGGPGNQQFQQGGMKGNNMPGGNQFQQGGMKGNNMPGGPGNQSFQQGGMKGNNLAGGPGNQPFQQGGMKGNNLPGGNQFQQGGMKGNNMPGGPGNQQFQQGGIGGLKGNMPGGNQQFPQGGGQQFQQGGIGGLKGNMPGGGQQFNQGGMGLKGNMPGGGQQFNQGGMKPGGGQQFPQGGMKPGGGGQFQQGGMKRDAMAAGGGPQAGGVGGADMKRPRY